MKFKVGDKVRYKAPTRFAPFGFDHQTGVVVGYWAERDLPPLYFTTDEQEADDSVGYPYFVRGFVSADEVFEDSAQTVYSEDELEGIE